jgi:hypothetical protein
MIEFSSLFRLDGRMAFIAGAASVLGWLPPRDWPLPSPWCCVPISTRPARRGPPLEFASAAVKPGRRERRRPSAGPESKPHRCGPASPSSIRPTGSGLRVAPPDLFEQRLDLTLHVRNRLPRQEAPTMLHNRL